MCEKVRISFVEFAGNMVYTIIKGGSSMYKILILDETEAFCQALAELLPDTFETYTSQDGEKFAELLQTIRPDFLVMDLGMPKIDSLYVLEAANFAGIRPCVLAVGNYISYYMERLLEQLKVSYFVRKPCQMQQLAARITDMVLDCQLQSDPQMPITNGDKVENFLRYLGFYPHLGGYKMLVTALSIMIDHPYISMTKELYPQVAEVWGTDWKQAEHAIRNCIQNAYKRRNDWIWKMYFPCDRDQKVGHLKNSVFLKCAASFLRETSLDMVMNL